MVPRINFKRVKIRRNRVRERKVNVECIIIVQALPWGGTSQRERRHQNVNHVFACLVVVVVCLVVVFLLLNGALKMELFFLPYIIIILSHFTIFDTFFKTPIIHAKQLLMLYALQHFFSNFI